MSFRSSSVRAFLSWRRDTGMSRCACARRRSTRTASSGCATTSHDELRWGAARSACAADPATLAFGSLRRSGRRLLGSVLVLMLLRHLVATVLLPVTVTVLVPVWIARRYGVVPRLGTSGGALLL